MQVFVRRTSWLIVLKVSENFRKFLDKTLFLLRESKILSKNYFRASDVFWDAEKQSFC